MSDDGHALSVSRLIDAPADRVWQVATTRLAEWWCPQPWRAEVIEVDWRAGGRFATMMHGPAGEAHLQEGLLLEVTLGRRFVFTDRLRAGWVPQEGLMLGIIALADEGGRTRYTGTARHWSAEAKARHAAMGFAEGWGAAADQLAAMAEAER